ncbi:MAG TPA: superinfection immunity protein [Chthoniobacterales bacterium]|nr:superinfection immunity protein [Chthoniobacterales bacterium]
MTNQQAGKIIAGVVIGVVVVCAASIFIAGFTDINIDPDHAGAMLRGFLVLALAAGAYFLPGLIGQSRHHHQRTAIWVLDLFLGWTILGWIIALVWASSATQGKGNVDAGSN